MLPIPAIGQPFNRLSGWTPLSVDYPYDAVQWLRGIDDVWYKDKVGTGTDRILNGGPGLQQGRCYDFDGTDDEVTVADEAALRPGTGDFSLSLWVRVDTVGVAEVIAGKTNGAVASTSLGWWVARTAADKFTFTVSKSGDSSTATSTTTLVADTWYHVVCVRDAGTPKIYVDGSLEHTGTTPSAISINGTDTLYFGSENSNSHLDGKLFGAVLYSDVLGAPEITYLYNFGRTGTNPTLANALGQWLMDEQSGTTAYDSSGNGRNGTLVGGLTHATQDIHSWHNRFGYKLSGAVFLPKDYGASGEVDINGDPLDYSGRAPFHAKLVDSYCGDFDGTNDYGEGTSPFTAGTDFKTQAFSTACWVATTKAATHGIITLGTSTGTNYMVQIVFISTTGQVRVLFHRADNNATGRTHVTADAGDAVTADEISHVAVTYDGTGTPDVTTVKIYINGTAASLVTSGGSTFNAYQQDKVSIGSTGGAGGNYLDGKLFDVKLYDDVLTANEVSYLHDRSGTDPGTGNLLTWWPLAEGSTAATAYNVVANSNHLTLNNITAATFWSASQDKLAYNATHGFRDSFGIRIPALLGTSNSADGGGAISNPAGIWHNDAESKIQRNPFGIPELLTHQIGFDADTAFDVRASEFTEKDQEWVYRESEIKLLDYTIFRQALVTTNRNDAWKYYQTVPTLNTEKTAAWKFEDSDWSSFTAADVVGSYDATDASSASDNPLGGKSGRMLEMYGTCDMAISPSLGTAVTAFTVSGFINVNDVTDDFMMFQLAGPSLEVGFESTTGKAYFTYNGTTIKGTTTLVGSTWYHVMAGINDYGHMTLFVNGDVENTGSATMLVNTNNQWSAGYGSSITAQEHIDEVYFFAGKRLTANVASRLNENYISSAGEFAAP